MRLFHVFILMGLALSLQATTHRGTLFLNDWSPAPGEEGPEIESMAIKWVFSDQNSQLEQGFFMQWYLGEYYIYNNQKWPISAMGGAEDRLSLSSLVLEVDLYVGRERHSTLEFDMGATPPHGGNWGSMVDYQWSWQKLFPNLNEREAKTLFQDGIRLKNLRIIEIWFGGRRAIRDQIRAGTAGESVAQERPEPMREPEEPFREPTPEPKPQVESPAQPQIEFQGPDGKDPFAQPNQPEESMRPVPFPEEEPESAPEPELEEIDEDALEVARDAALRAAIDAISEQEEDCQFAYYQYHNCRLKSYRLGESLIDCYQPDCDLVAEIPRPEDYFAASQRKLIRYEATGIEDFLGRSRSLLDSARLYDSTNALVWMALAQEEGPVLDRLVMADRALQLDESLISAEQLKLSLMDSLHAQIFADIEKGNTQRLKKALLHGLVDHQTVWQDKNMMQVAIGQEQLPVMEELLAWTDVSRNVAGGPVQDYLFEAAAQNKPKAAKLFLTKGATTNYAREDGETPLSLAARMNSRQVLKLFVRDRNSQDDISRAVQIAAKENHRDAVRLLLASSPISDPVDELGNSLLMQVIAIGDTQMIDVVFDYDPDVNHQNKKEETPLVIATQRRNQSVIRQLLRKGAKPLPALEVMSIEADRDAAFLAENVFAYAMENDLSDWVPMCIKYETELPLRSHKSGVSYLTYCLEEDKWEMCAALLEGTKLPLEKRIDGEYFLFRAIRKQAVPVVEMLLKEQEVSLSRLDRASNSALHIAVTRGNLEICEVLVEADHPLELQDREGNTPLHMALALKQAKIAEYLADQNYSYEVLNRDNQHPIHMAVVHKQVEVVRLLLENGTNINLPGEDQMTPLHYAVEERAYSCARLLLNEGADKNARDRSGRTPRKMARLQKDRTMTTIFREDMMKLPDVNLPDVKMPDIKLPELPKRKG